MLVVGAGFWEDLLNAKLGWTLPRASRLGGMVRGPPQSNTLL